jgi:hypothetical protein
VGRRVQTCNGAAGRAAGTGGGSPQGKPLTAAINAIQIITVRTAPCSAKRSPTRQ